MTLGRTSSGAIKIKTDGGLRAVECGCCGGSGCIKPNPELKQILETWTSVQVTYSFPAFPIVGVPVRSGSFNMPKCDIDLYQCLFQHDHVIDGVWTSPFYSFVDVTPEGFIYFDLWDDFGRVRLNCGLYWEGEMIGIPVNGRIYTGYGGAGFPGFELPPPTVSLTFS